MEEKTYGESVRIGHETLDLFVEAVLLFWVQSEHGEGEAKGVGSRLCPMLCQNFALDCDNDSLATDLMSLFN